MYYFVSQLQFKQYEQLVRCKKISYPNPKYCMSDNPPVLSCRSAMFPRLPVYLLTFFPVLLVQSSTTTSPKYVPADPPPRPPSPVGDPTWCLGLRLYKAVRSDLSPVNILFSPLLVASSLGALGEGSAGATASQVQNLLKTPSSSSSKVGDLLSSAFKSFTEANGTAFHLHASSGIFSKQAPSVSKAFVKASQSKFRLQHTPLGKGDAEADLKQLRGWAKAGLGGLDGDALQAEIQAKAGALILANALSFKGERGWCTVKTSSSPSWHLD